MALFNMSPKKNEMPTQDACVRNGNFEEVALGYTKEQADKFHAEVLEQIRNSKYSQELAKLNDIKL